MTDYSIDNDMVITYAEGSICNVYYRYRGNKENTRFVIEFEINGSVELSAHGNIRIVENDHKEAHRKFVELRNLFCMWCGFAEKCYKE